MASGICTPGGTRCCLGQQFRRPVFPEGTLASPLPKGQSTNSFFQELKLLRLRPKLQRLSRHHPGNSLADRCHKVEVTLKL